MGRGSTRGACRISLQEHGVSLFSQAAFDRTGGHNLKLHLKKAQGGHHEE